jgi:hypothetical protein
MSSELVKLYDAALAEGCRPNAAVRRLACRVGVDDETIRRTLYGADPRRFPMKRHALPKERL